MSSLVYTTRVSLTIVERAYNLISNYCLENVCFYIDNRNIGGFCLYKDGCHLLQSGSKILPNSFTVHLNNFFIKTHTPSTNIFLNDSDLTLFRMGVGPKRPPTSFSPVTSTNVGISPTIFLTYSFNPFATLL